MRRPLGTAIVGLALAGTAAVSAAAPPARPLVRLDEEFAAAVQDLVRRAEAGGFVRLAALVAGWPLPAEAARFVKNLDFAPSGRQFDSAFAES